MTDTNKAQNELDIIIGQRQITLADKREITVRAYTFMDSMKVMRIAGPLLQGLQDYYRDMHEADEDDFDLTGLNQVFFADPDAMVQLLAYASDLTAAEIAELGDEDGSKLLWTWWNVNCDFFTRRLGSNHQAKAALKLVKEQRKASRRSSAA